MTDLTQEQAAKLAPTVERLLSAARKVAADVEKQVAMLRETVGSFKYIVTPERFITVNTRYLPHFQGINSVFEIGVGPGYLFSLLHDVMGIRITGVDVAAENHAYASLRREIGIDHLVTECEVRSGHDIPIPEATEVVAAFHPVFHRNWTFDDHAWFVDHCRSKGVKAIYWRFNKRPALSTLMPFYQPFNPSFPMKDDPFLCLVPLDGAKPGLGQAPELSPKSKKKRHKESARSVMAALQKIVAADSPVQLEAAIGEARALLAGMEGRD